MIEPGRTWSAQIDTTPPRAPAPGGAIASAVPFPVGERMTFQAKFGLFNVGRATLEVVGLDTVAGTETVRLRFHLQGSALWYELDQQLESWVGRRDFRSRR